MADGEIVSARMAAAIRDSFGAAGHTHLSLWRTEYNYPGAWVSLPPLYDPTGGMHALFMAGHLLAALEHAQSAVPFEVLMLHCLAHQASAGWTSSNSTLLIVGDSSDDMAAVRVGAVAQVFAHLADSALRKHGAAATVRSVFLSAECPTVNLSLTKGQANSSCVQSTAFADANSTMTIVLMNRCEDPVHLQLRPGAGTGAMAVKASTTYLADDPGWWAVLPPTDAALPWQAPMTPSTQACGLGTTGCILPPVSLTIVDMS